MLQKIKLTNFKCFESLRLTLCPAHLAVWFERNGKEQCLAGAVGAAAVVWFG